MNLKEYIHNLQQRPVQERKKIAVVATAVGFAVILLIWVVSFNEMNKPVENQTDPASASLNDLKDNFQTGKDSIQNMMQDLPSQALPAEETGGTFGADSATNNVGAPGMDSSAVSIPPTPDGNLQNPNDSLNSSENLQNINNAPPPDSINPDQKPSGVPQLP